MANTNPYKARIAKARRKMQHVPDGDLKQARGILWAVVTDGAERLRNLDPENNNDYYKLANALTGVIREFRSLLESAELEERVSALEATKTGWVKT